MPAVDDTVGVGLALVVTYLLKSDDIVPVVDDTVGVGLALVVSS